MGELSWFLRDVDGHYSSKRLIAFVLVAAWLFFAGIDTAGIPVKAELMSALGFMIGGFGGLSVAERFQPSEAK